MKLLLMALAAQAAAPPAVPVRMAGISWKVVDAHVGCALESPVINGTKVGRVRLYVRNGRLWRYGLQMLQPSKGGSGLTDATGSIIYRSDLASPTSDGFLLFSPLSEQEMQADKELRLDAKDKAPLLVQLPGEDLQVELEGAESQLDALGDCQARRLTTLFGQTIDERLVVTQATPKQSAQSLFGPGDYPYESWKMGGEGKTWVIMPVGTDGLTLGCKIFMSAGREDLDATACKRYSKMKFRPALDAQGRPVIDVAFMNVAWRLGDSNQRYKRVGQ